jgi:hypothetical protein
VEFAMRNHWFLLGVLAFAGCNQANLPPTSEATSKTIAAAESWEIEFSKWPKATERPHAVAFINAYDCRALHTEDLTKTYGPHFKPSIVVRVNPEAIEDFKAMRPVAVGTVVIKEKYSEWDASKPPHGFTAMIKREPGYDPDHGNWEYADVQLQLEKKVARGKIASCIACHDGKKNEDYLFRNYLK